MYIILKHENILQMEENVEVISIYNICIYYIFVKILHNKSHNLVVQCHKLHRQVFGSGQVGFKIFFFNNTYNLNF